MVKVVGTVANAGTAKQEVGGGSMRYSNPEQSWRKWRSNFKYPDTYTIGGGTFNNTSSQKRVVIIVITGGTGT